MPRRTCNQLAQNLKEYLAKEDDNIKDILREQSIGTATRSPDRAKKNISKYPISKMVRMGSVALVVPLILILIYTFGIVGGITGLPYPFDRSIKRFY